MTRSLLRGKTGAGNAASPLRISERAAAGAKPGAALTLPYELRCRSRLRAALDDGRDAAIVLPRGETLRDGDLLRAEDGTVIAVRAAPEECSRAAADDGGLLARACYHLGNRHIALQIGADFVRYLHDHVLDEMVRALGLAVSRESAPFEPEPGAYPGAGGSAASGHHQQPGRGHSHAHNQDHRHPHVH